MMTLKDVKDWLKIRVSTDIWRIGTYDISRDRAVCAHSLTGSRSMLAVGNLQNATAAVKGIFIVVHWSKNLDGTEYATQGMHALFYRQQPKVGDYRVIKYDMRSDEPISVGTGADGICKCVIGTRLTYERKE